MHAAPNYKYMFGPQRDTLPHLERSRWSTYDQKHYDETKQRAQWRSEKKEREKSRECHNHKPQPFPDPKRKRKPTNLNKHKPNKRTKSTKISSLFPKRGNRNTKRTEKHKNKMTHGKTDNKSPRRINHKATKSKTNTGTTALERSVEQTTGGFKALLQVANFTLGPNAILNTEIHKNSVPEHRTQGKHKRNTRKTQTEPRQARPQTLKVRRRPSEADWGGVESSFSLKTDPIPPPPSTHTHTHKHTHTHTHTHTTHRAISEGNKVINHAGSLPQNKHVVTYLFVANDNLLKLYRRISFANHLSEYTDCVAIIKFWFGQTLWKWFQTYSIFLFVCLPLRLNPRG